MILPKIQKLRMFYEILENPLLPCSLVVDIRKDSINHLISLLHNFAFRISYKKFLQLTNLKFSPVKNLKSKLRLIKSMMNQFIFDRKITIHQKRVLLLVVIKVNLSKFSTK